MRTLFVTTFVLQRKMDPTCSYKIVNVQAYDGSGPNHGVTIEWKQSKHECSVVTPEVVEDFREALYVVNPYKETERLARKVTY